MTIKTVIVAMSGGVDSAVVAAIMKSSGYNVIGVTLQLSDSLSNEGCCTISDINDARNIAHFLGIKHYVLNYTSTFQRYVINNFIKNYVKGYTPIPCIKCNEFIKFFYLLKLLQELGGGGLATGHYVRLVFRDNKVELHRALDLNKDQSYFLFSINRKILSYLFFPLGKLYKKEVRYLAEKYGLINVFAKKDSQGICFVKGHYTNFIQSYYNCNSVGKFIHMDGFDIGVHKGIMFYTVGQRKGLGIKSNEVLYVIKIDIKNNVIFVGPKKFLSKTSFFIKNFNFLVQDINILNIGLTLKVRSNSNCVLGMLNIHRDVSKLKVIMYDTNTIITPGQACVFYKDSLVLGGGWIT